MKKHVLGALLIGGASLLAHGKVQTLENSFKGFVFSRCQKAQGKCIRVTSPLAEGSHFGPIYNLKNPQIEISAISHTDKEHLNCERGYLDFTHKIVVCMNQTKTTSFETVIKLESMKQTTYRVAKR